MNAEDSVEISALSIDEAVIIGLTRLEATRDQVNITVLDEGSRGFLGLGTRMARVLLTLRSAEAEESAAYIPPSVAPIEVPQHELAQPLVADQETVMAGSSGDTTAPVVLPISRDEMAKSERPKPVAASMVSEDTAMLYQRVEEVVKLTADHLLGSLAVQISTEWQDEEGRPVIWVSIRGTDADAVVGPHAQTLNAVQYLLRTLVHRQVDGNYDLVVDADGYRMRRLRSLESLAQQNADKAVESGRTVRLRSMPAHERRVIHMLLREDDRVQTRSVGTGRERAVTIIPTSESDK
ncbi:MAG: hypothetical protein E4H27_01950 [Anaerolineales bacterium]|nr:MAG: hypothetical protein E4H27_01950 [Anaerolineales bacterium]